MTPNRRQLPSEMVLNLRLLIAESLRLSTIKCNESQVTEANNLKVTIGALKLAGRNETQTLKVQRIKVC
jgi:hypothetical protein